MRKDKEHPGLKTQTARHGQQSSFSARLQKLMRSSLHSSTSGHYFLSYSYSSVLAHTHITFFQASWTEIRMGRFREGRFIACAGVSKAEMRVNGIQKLILYQQCFWHLLEVRADRRKTKPLRQLVLRCHGCKSIISFALSFIKCS